MDVSPLKEEDAYPAQPQDAYGWEKLIAERLALHYQEDYGLNTHIVRFHNIFGPRGSWVGGREKAPAAFCRKIAVAKLSGNPIIDLWGDGEQTRSFCYIDDCVFGLMKLMGSDFHDPLNLGSDRMVSMNDLGRIIAGIAGTSIEISHIDGPQGVRGRNSDNNLLRKVLGWEPAVTLEEGLEVTYRWIEDLVRDYLDRAPDRKKAIEELRTSRIYQPPCA